MYLFLNKMLTIHNTYYLDVFAIIETIDTIFFD